MSFMVLASALFMVSASASTLQVDAGGVAAGAAALVPCDPNGIETRFAFDPVGRVTSVALHGVAASCAGGALEVSLATSSSTVSIGELPLPTGFAGGTVELALSNPVLPVTVTDVHVAIVGE